MSSVKAPTFAPARAPCARRLATHDKPKPQVRYQADWRGSVVS